MEARVLYNIVAKVGLVYLRLVKYMFRLILTLKCLKDKRELHYISEI